MPVPRKAVTPFDLQIFLNHAGEGRALMEYQKSEVIFRQGDVADAVFYIQRGKTTLTVVSKRGKEAVIAILGVGEFFGEGCLGGQQVRKATATAMSLCSVMRLDKPATARVLHKEPAFSTVFLAYVLRRSIRIEEDLVDQLFNSSEKRLARVLLLLANFGKEGNPEPMPKISQKTLAEIVGTTRSRVSFFMSKFRRLGFIDYKNGLKVHNSLLNVVLHD